MQDHREQAIAQYNLARAHEDQGDIPGALDNYRRAIGLCPGQCFYQAHSNLGALLLAQGQPQAAIAEYRRALDGAPDVPELHHNLGNAHSTLGQYDEAAVAYGHAIALRPDYADAMYGLGQVRAGQDRIAEAATLCEQAIALCPTQVDAWNTLGNLRRRQGRIAEGIACLRQAIGLWPGFAEAHSNLGIALHEQGEYEAAIRSYRQALALRPEYGEAHYNLALSLLTVERFEEGWREYAWRWGAIQPLRDLGPRWDGSPLHGRTLLVHAEQGLGDTLQFVRHVPRVRGRVVLECQPELLRLLRLADLGGAQCVPRGDELPDFAVSAGLLDLPRLLGPVHPGDHVSPPYLRAPDEGSSLPARDGWPRVGLVWGGNPQHRNDYNRSLPAELLRPLVSESLFRFFSLQKGPHATELSHLPPEVMDLGARAGDMADTASLLTQIDLLIAVDTSVAHLAGALGRPVWVLLPHAADWRWLSGRRDCPDYPTARLFRQGRPGDWPSVVTQVRDELGKWPNL